MKEVNGYYSTYSENDRRIDFLKYGLLNEFGPSLNRKTKETYCENKIIKKECNNRRMK